VESQQGKIDQSVAEMRGSYRGLSEELNQHIRYVSDLESRMSDVKRQLGEELRVKVAEIEQNHLTSSAALRSSASSGEDHSRKLEKRLSDLESLVGTCVDRLRNEPSVDDLNTRLAEMEAHMAQVNTLALSGGHRDGGAAGELAVVSGAGAETASRLAYASEKIESLLGDSHEVHMQLAAQEERLNLLRTKIDTHDGNHRRLSDRMGGHDYQSLVRDIHIQIQDGAQKQSEHLETLKRVSERLDGSDQVIKGHVELLDTLCNSPDSEFARLEARLEDCQ
jgi:phage shock protein A